MYGLANHQRRQWNFSREPVQFIRYNYQHNISCKIQCNTFRSEEKPAGDISLVGLFWLWIFLNGHQHHQNKNGCHSDTIQNLSQFISGNRQCANQERARVIILSLWMLKFILSELRWLQFHFKKNFVDGNVQLMSPTET